jgi:cytochrome c553
MSVNIKLSSLAVLLMLLGMTGCVQPTEGAARGKALYARCVSCHGPDGGGKLFIKVPAIAGLPTWYIETQFKNFQQQIRGAHYDDLPGHRMRPVARMFTGDDADTKAVAGYVESMPGVVQTSILKGGDPTAGKAAYVVCTACHGTEGKGNKALGTPDIRYSGDWYLYEQLKKFKSGMRGADPRDIRGATMRPNAMAMDDQAMKDVIAYIMTLKK